MKKVLSILIFIFLAFSQAFAHKISIFTDLEGSKLSLYSYFSDGTPAKHSKVTIYDESSGKVVKEGYTDNGGNYSCNLPRPGRYKVVVLAELGHRATAEVVYGKVEEKMKTGKNNRFNSIHNLPLEDMRKMVEEELKVQLQPINRKLLKIEEKVSSVSITEVFGGIGWIIGLFGAAAFGYCYRRDN